MYRIKTRSRLQINKAGFTLVELIVAIAIMLILAGGAVVGFTKILSNSKYQQQCDTAKSLYIAAQNQLTEWKSTGTLEKFSDELKNSSGSFLRVLDVTKLTDLDGNYYTDIWNTAQKNVNGTTTDLPGGTIVYLSCKPGEYASYKKNPTAFTNQTGQVQLFALLESYLYDTSFLDAAISVELCPETGVVFAVCYSSKAEGFSYYDAATGHSAEYDPIVTNPQELAKYISICNRKADYCRQNQFGYYGVDVLSIETNYAKDMQKATKPVLASVSLNNEDTLNLSFKEIKCSAINRLTYHVTVYEKDAPSVGLFSLSFDGSAVHNQENKALVSAIDEHNGTEYKIMAWIDAEQAMHIVLDAVDYAQNLLADAYPDNDKELLSFQRFGVDAENIFCTVYGTSSSFKATNVKQSNTESVYFESAEKTENGAGGCNYTYALSNARHLFNMRNIVARYQTASLGSSGGSYSDKDEVLFALKNDIDWEGFAVHSKQIYKQSKLPETEAWSFNNEFLAIGSLPANVTLDGKNQCISGLTVTKSANESHGLTYEGKTELPATGIFLVNKGIIKSLNLDRISVLGEENVGSFCGINAGQIENLKVLNSDSNSKIKGNTHVGGIFGLLDIDASTKAVSNMISVVDCENRAVIEGTSYVGGIVGLVEVKPASTNAVLITDCKNYGHMTAAITGADKTEAKYLGGIIGCAVNRQADTSMLRIENCNSSPQYSAQELGLLFNSLDKTEFENKLNGIYVGGIAGYSFFASVSNCSTQAERTEGGYILGYEYVGGIVGFHEGPANSSIDGNTGSARGINEANVIGVKYVGGITGCSSDIKSRVNDIVEPETQKNYGVRLTNWVNRGFVYATEAFAGGISGYNTGWIYNCNSEVRSNTVPTAFMNTYAYSGNCIGGIAGYNAGIIGNTKRREDNYQIDDGRSASARALSLTCYVTGQNYVGGVVGYNDAGGIIEDYQVSGGYIRANKSESYFAGGYVGYNASTYMMMDTDHQPLQITSNPNEVTGKYFVGGIIGGNMMNMHGISEDTLKANFTTNNFLGEITGTEFVGGFIGYNLLYKDATMTYSWDQTIDKRLIAKMQSQGSSLLDKIQALERFVEEDDVSRCDDVDLLVTQKNNETGTNRFGKITADVYVGGVIGYCDANVHLTLKNILNTTQLVANTAIENSGEQPGRTTDYAGTEKVFYYSYAGGIVGKVSKHTTLDSCSNSRTATITAAAATYKGSLCELNEGQIINCAIDSVGNSTAQYIGGLCGLNKAGALIRDCVCTSTQKNITGKNVVGGIAAENFGTIRDVTVNSSVFMRVYGGGGISGTDGVAGFYAAYNGSTGRLVVNRDLSNLIVDSSGDYVGGVVGINAGVVENGLDYDTDKVTERRKISGNIQGRKYVGGIIGKNVSSVQKCLYYFTNQASITAKYGNAGGLLGENGNEGFVISYCENSCTDGNKIMASVSGNAGGICANNLGKIEYCYNFSTIESHNGKCGGISAVNGSPSNATAVIDHCYINKSGSPQLTFTSRDTVGGIVAENYAQLNGCKMYNVTVKNYTTSEASNIGVMAGINYPTGEIKISGTDVGKGCQARTYTNNSNVGGMVGCNQGYIFGMNLEGGYPQTLVHCDVAFEGTNASIASFGGVVGKNEGLVEKISVVDGKLEGNLNSDLTGYGGICGYSVDTGAFTSSIVGVRFCTFDGGVTAKGAANAIARIGGIVGTNGEGSTIESCILGRRDSMSTSVKGMVHAYVGGICGENYGTIVGGDNKALSKNASVTVENKKGNVGGIAGINQAYASVSGKTENDILSTGEKWKIETGECEEYGGILGFCYSASEIKWVENYAGVDASSRSTAQNPSVGGLIGRIEFTYASQIKITDCINQGYVHGKWRAGGMVGTIKSAGAYFKNCKNYGTIQGENSIGGILANARDLNYGIFFDGCSNHGELIAYDDCGGILGRYESNASPKEMDFVNCINTGAISATNHAGGMCGQTNKRYYLVNCRNYSPSSIKAMIGDVFAWNGNTAVMINCLDASKKHNELVAGSQTTYAFNNYVIGGTGDLPEGMYFDCRYEGTVSGSKSYTAEEIFDNNVEKDFKVDQGRTLTLYIDVKNSSINAIHSFSLLLHSYKKVVHDSQQEGHWTEWIRENPYEVSFQAILEGGEKGAVVTIKQDQMHTWYEYNDYKYEMAAANLAGSYYKKVTGIVIRIKPTTDHVIIRGMGWSYKDYAAYKDAQTCNYSSYQYSPKGMALLSEGSGRYNLYASIGDSHATDYELDSSPVDTDDYLTKDTYEPLDNLYQKFLMNCYDVVYKLSAPGTLAIETNNSECVFSWSSVPNAYGYEVYYELWNNDSFTGKRSEAGFVMGLTKLAINRADIEALADGTPFTELRCYVRTVNAYEYKHPTDKSYSSDFVSTATDMKKKILPTPLVHIELTSDNRAVFVIDNYDDYKENVVDSNEYLECTIKASVNGIEKSIAVQAGKYSDPFTLDGINLHSDYTFTVLAEPEANSQAAEGYLASALYTSTGLLIGNNNLREDAEVIRVKSEGFEGISEEDLSYKAVMSASDTNLFVKCDLLAYDDELNNYIAYASETGEIRARFNYNFSVDTNVTLTNNLTSLIGRSFMVIKYIDSSAGKMVQMGHEVAERVSKEELKAYLDSTDVTHIDANSLDAENKKIVDGEGHLRPGYVVAKNADDTYHIFYNATLALSVAGSPKHVYTMLYVYDPEQSCYTWKDEKGQEGTLYVQPEPVLDENYVISSDNGHYAYTFSWDSMSRKSDAVYTVQLFGTTIEGEMTLLQSATGITGHSYQFVDDQDNWNYTRLTLRVVRLGEAEKGRTTHLPKAAGRTYLLKNKLDTITAPQISLLRVNGAYNTDELDYEIVWNAITDKNQQKELGGYMIRAEVVNNEDGDLSRVGQTQYYYVLEDEKCDLAYFYENGSLPQNYRDVTQTFDWVENSTTQRRAVINLSTFHEKDIVAISVRALAKADGIVEDKEIIREYMHGNYGDSSTQAIPTRLATPDIRMLSSNVESMPLMTVSAMNGTSLEFKWNDPDYVGTDGSYYIAVDLVSPIDTSEGELDSPIDNSQMVYGSNVLPTLDFIHTQNVVPLVKKEDKVRMTEQGLGNQLWLGYTLNLAALPEIRLADYAGWWVRVSLKKHSENAISSMWTDEDSKMISYYVAQLPKVQLEEPVVSYGNGTILYYNTASKFWYDTNDENESMQHVAKCRDLMIYATEYATAYTFDIDTRDGRKIELKLVQNPLDTRQYYVYSKGLVQEGNGTAENWNLLGAVGGTHTDGSFNTAKVNLSGIYSMTFDFVELGLSNIEMEEETTEGTESTEDTEGTEGTESSEGTESTESTEGTGSSEGTESTESTEEAGSSEGTESTESTEGTGSSESTESTEGAESSSKNSVTIGSYIRMVEDSMTGNLVFIIGLPDVLGYGTNGSVSTDVTTTAYQFTKNVTITAFPAENTAYAASTAKVFPIHAALSGQLFTCSYDVDKTRIRFHQLIMMSLETFFRYRLFLCIV